MNKLFWSVCLVAAGVVLFLIPDEVENDPELERNSDRLDSGNRGNRNREPGSSRDHRPERLNPEPIEPGTKVVPPPVTPEVVTNDSPLTA